MADAAISMPIIAQVSTSPLGGGATMDEIVIMDAAHIVEEDQGLRAMAVQRRTHTGAEAPAHMDDHEASLSLTYLVVMARTFQTFKSSCNKRLTATLLLGSSMHSKKRV